jgi:hypothetical protein
MLTKPLPGVMDDPSHPLSQGCVCHLLFNEGAGSLASDVSGHGNHGTLKNMLPNTQGSGWQGSKFGGGLGFDGTNDYVDCGNNVSLNISSAKTVSLWVNLDVVNTDQVFIAKEGAIGTGAGWQIIFDDVYGASPDIFSIWGNGLRVQNYMIEHVADKWYHIIALYDGTNSKLYVDNVEEASTAGNVFGFSTSDHLSIGALSTGGTPFNGSIDNVRVYNGALNAEERKQLYHVPFCNLIQIPAWQLYSPAAPTGAIINQFQRYNLGADLYDGVLIT